MTSRERVTASFTFRAPDRVPIDLNLTLFAYQSLLGHLGSQLQVIPQPNTAMEVVPDPSVLGQIGVDLISVKPGREEKLKKGVSVDDLPQTTTDGWGITRKLVRQSTGDRVLFLRGVDIGSYYREISPCKSIRSI